MYCEYGLADIRVIVFNLIPVAAMLRVPTKESDGKANLDRGAIGM
jgi:glutathione synthase/RimK-type ligase-like ATP-grasp enzyme